MVFLNSGLSSAHLRGLKEHKYKAEGTSIAEVVFQPFWRWTVTQIPLWVAPNLLTFIGLVVNLSTCVSVIVTDPKAEGISPPILYLLAGLGTFIYQTLDGIDGKQARRTGTNNPLGELFDHGCDGISTFIVALAGACAVGLNDYPYLLLGFVLCIEFVNYVYHWQTYVSGCLYFKKIDCTEAQLCHIAVMFASYIAGPDIWKFTFPVLGVPLMLLVAIGVIGSSIVNVISAFVIIFSQGIGKNGATVADTSVLSPILPVAILLYCSIFYCLYSPSAILLHHPMLLLLTMMGPMVKFIFHIIIAGMCKTPLPLFDPVLIGPVIIIVNVMIGPLVSEFYLLLILTIFNLYDLASFCIAVVKQICEYLEVNCFTIPFPPPSMTTSTATAN